MTNPTTPFSWQMPTSTDLVTDLPADFETFGQAVATSMADLLGGTTGQILAKASNTDMDFTWVTNDVGDITAVTAGTGISGGGTSGAVTITNSMATEIAAKGDLIVGTGSATFDNLTAGNNGETLVADSSTSTGLRWQGNYVAGKNFFFNGAMDIWQRGTSITTSGGYTADRWQQYTTGVQTTSRQTTSDTTNLPQIQYCARVQRNSGATSTGVFALGTSLESVMTTPMAGQTVTLSFYGRKGANFSGTNLVVQLIGGTGTDQNVISGFTGATVINGNQTATLTSTWQRFTWTFSVASTYTQLGLQTYFLGVGTAGANDYYEITGIQLEIGSVATAFSRAGGNIQGELAACRYYYRRNTATGNAYGSVLAPTVIANATTAAVAYWQEAPMRAIPTSVEFANIAFADTVSVYAITAIVLNGSNTLGIPTLTVTSSGLTQYRNYSIVGNNNAAGYIAVSAEL